MYHLDIYTLPELLDDLPANFIGQHISPGDNLVPESLITSENQSDPKSNISEKNPQPFKLDYQDFAYKDMDMMSGLELNPQALSQALYDDYMVTLRGGVNIPKHENVTRKESNFSILILKLSSLFDDLFLSPQTPNSPRKNGRLVRKNGAHQNSHDAHVDCNVKVLPPPGSVLDPRSLVTYEDKDLVTSNQYDVDETRMPKNTLKTFYESRRRKRRRGSHSTSAASSNAKSEISGCLSQKDEVKIPIPDSLLNEKNSESSFNNVESHLVVPQDDLDVGDNIGGHNRKDLTNLCMASREDIKNGDFNRYLNSSVKNSVQTSVATSCAASIRNRLYLVNRHILRCRIEQFSLELTDSIIRESLQISASLLTETRSPQDIFVESDSSMSNHNPLNRSIFDNALDAHSPRLVEIHKQNQINFLSKLSRISPVPHKNEVPKSVKTVDSLAKDKKNNLPKNRDILWQNSSSKNRTKINHKNVPAGFAPHQPRQHSSKNDTYIYKWFSTTFLTPITHKTKPRQQISPKNGTSRCEYPYYLPAPHFGFPNPLI
ncbi:unnamed protein product [Gordionus sp. m RMFG-2023]